MRFGDIRTQIVADQPIFLLEDVSRWLRINEGKAKKFLKAAYPDALVRERLYLSKYQSIRTTWCTKKGVVLVACEYSKASNARVRQIVYGDANMWDSG